MSSNSEYVYVPKAFEWSIMLRSEWEQWGNRFDFPIEGDAELVFSLGGHRGHYLAADFILEASQLPEVMALVDGDTYVKVQDCTDLANQYHRHHDIGGYIPEVDGDNDDTECKVDPKTGYYECSCEYISEAADEIERIIGEYGYICEWDDGVSCFKVHTPNLQCEFHDNGDNPAVAFAPQSTDLGTTVTWHPVCEAHAEYWWDGADWTGDIHRIMRQLTPSDKPISVDDYQ